jgi:hypothetical protein
LLNNNEIDARVTMQEIIEGYPYIEKHKDLVVNESIEYEKKGFESPNVSRNNTMSPYRSISYISRPVS